MELLIVIFLQFCYIVFKEVIHFQEREAMRVIAKADNVGQYKAVTTPVAEEEVDDSMDGMIPMSEATLEDFQDTLKKN